MIVSKKTKTPDILKCGVRFFYCILILSGLLLLVCTACSIRRQATPDAPTVTLLNPQPGDTLPVGETVSVQSTSKDSDGVQRVELWVDNALVRVDANPEKSSSYTVSQRWQSAMPGTHVIVVKAFDTQGTQGQSLPIAITLGEEVQAQSIADPTATALASPVPSPAAPSTPTPSPADTPPVMCTPPLCEADEVFYCPDECPAGCGTQCATPTPGPTPPTFEPTGVEVHERLKPVWEQPEVKDYLGHPSEEAEDKRHYARQYFERGFFYWWEIPDEPGLIWVIEIEIPGANWGLRWSGPYEDTWDGENPISCKEAQSSGPVRGFGKLWCDRPEIAQVVGSPREPERGTGDTSAYGIVQFFQGGVMLYSPLDSEVWVLFEGGTWHKYPG